MKERTRFTLQMLFIVGNAFGIGTNVEAEFYWLAGFNAFVTGLFLLLHFSHYCPEE